MLKTKIDNIVFIKSGPVSTADAEMFGFEYLKNQGFCVKVYELSQLLYKNMMTNDISVFADNCIHVNSFCMLNDLVAKDAPCSLFVDMFAGLSDFGFKTEKIYRILKANNARYVVVHACVLPSQSPLNGVIGYGMYLLMKLKSATNPKTLVDFLVKKAFFIIRLYSHIYPFPVKIFAMPTDEVSQYVQRFKISQKDIVNIHSFDYDLYLKFIKSKNHKKLINYNYCVFLDQAFTHHPDFIRMGKKHINEDKYFKSMNEFFNTVEKKTGLKVVIAAHPRSKYETIPNAFDGRMIIKDKTIGLVGNSSMVIAHSSTSVNFAVLFNKPIIIVKTSDMEKMGNLDRTDKIAEELGLESININDEKSVNKLSFNFTEWPKDGFEKYKYKYIMCKNVENLTAWEIVIRSVSEQIRDL